MQSIQKYTSKKKSILGLWSSQRPLAYRFNKNMRKICSLILFFLSYFRMSQNLVLSGRKCALFLLIFCPRGRSISEVVHLVGAWGLSSALFLGGLRKYALFATLSLPLATKIQSLEPPPAQPNHPTTFLYLKKIINPYQR